MQQYQYLFKKKLEEKWFSKSTEYLSLNKTFRSCLFLYEWMHSVSVMWDGVHCLVFKRARRGWYLKVWHEGSDCPGSVKVKYEQMGQESCHRINDLMARLTNSLTNPFSSTHKKKTFSLLHRLFHPDQVTPFSHWTINHRFSCSMFWSKIPFLKLSWILEDIYHYCNVNLKHRWTPQKRG